MPVHIKPSIKVWWMHKIINESIAYVIKVIVLIKVAPSFKMPLLPARLHLLWLIPQRKIPCSVTEVWVWGCMFGESEERAPAQLWVSRPHYFCSCLQLTSPSRSPTLSALSRHPASFPSLIFDAKLTAGETLSSWLYFSSCVILFLSSFYDFSPRGKNRKSYFFPPSALQGVEQILNSMKWSCQGLKAFSGPNHLSVHLGAGWVKYLISCQQNPVLFRFHGRRKKRKYKISEMRGRYMSKDHFFCSHSKHWRILSWPELCIVEEFLWPRSTFLL